MLALIKDSQFISQHREGSRLDLNEFSIHGATEGWVHDGYSLHKIQDAEAVPEGKVSTATTVDFIDGHWISVHTLADEPVPTPQELRAAMPDKTPREFRDILTDMGIFPQMVTDKIMEIPFEIERQKALNAWEVMTSASRVDPYIDMIGAMFDKTPEQIDAAWLMDA